MSAPVKQLRPAPPAPARVESVARGEKSLAYISSRWTPHQVVRDDRGAGVFEAVNPALLSMTEILTQRALLASVTDPASLQRIEAARVARRVNQGASQ